MSTPGDTSRPGDSVESFREWLERIGLGQLAEVLLNEGIDFDVAPALTEEHLRACGVMRLGDRLRFIQEIQRRTRTSAIQPPEAEQTPEPSEFTEQGSLDERRQLTAMFCDLVNYRDIARRFDGEIVNRMLVDYRRVCGEIVTRYGGFVAEEKGDGLVVYFGAPDAHEDDAERGVRSALEIVKAVRDVVFDRPLEVHIGIATGPVVFVNGRAVGETLVMAEGLSKVARQGQAVIDSATLRMVGRRFEVFDCGMCALKEHDTPVRAWRVEGLRNNPGRFPAAHPDMELTPLIGRDVEVDLLHRCWTWAHSGEGQVVLVCGEPGIGKSRLTHALRERIRPAPHKALFYQCSSFRLNSALYPIMQQLEFASGFASEDTPAEKLDKLERLLAGTHTERHQAAALLAAFMALPTDRYPTPSVTPQRQKENLLHALTEQAVALSHETPVLIVFEDVHWIDPTSQELLDMLVPRLRALRVMMVITYRPQYVAHWGGYPHVSRIDLTGLPPHLGTELVDQVTLGKSLPPGVRQQIVSRADGVPLFIEELTKSVLESQLLEEQNDRYALLDPLRAMAIPATLSASLNERLGRRASVRELAQIGACIGREFSYELLNSVAPYSGGEFDDELEQLTATGLVFRRGTPPDAVYTFKHALVQDAAYGSLLNSKKAHLHGEIARVLELKFPERAGREHEVLAHHWTEANRLDAAIPAWRHAGEAALARVALKEAVAYLEKGLELVDRARRSRETGQARQPLDHDRLELELRKPLHAARLRWHGWAAPDVQANATAMLTLAERVGDREGLLIGLWGTWVSTVTQGRVAEAPPWARRLLDEGNRADSLDLQILGHRALVSSLFHLGELEEARAQADMALSLYARHGQDRARRWMALTGSDVRTAVDVFRCQCVWMLGYPDQAVAITEARDAEAERIGNPFDSGWAKTWGAYVFEYRREPERLLARVEEAARIGQEQSIPMLGSALVPIGRGLAMLRSGRFAEAIPLLQQGIAGWNASGGHLHEPYMKCALAEAWAQSGNLDEASRLIDEALAQVLRPGWEEKVWLPEVLRLKAWLLMRAGRVPEAEELLHESIANARAQQARSWELRSATLLAELLAARGERAVAYEALVPIYGWFTEGFSSHDLVAARGLLDMLRPADTVQASVAGAVVPGV